MLVTFTTKAYADITLFGDVAQHLLDMMGQSGNIPGAIVAEDIPAALERLKTKVAQQQAVEEKSSNQDDSDDDSDDAAAVGVKRRAWPLIQLLEAAVAKDADVIWKESGT